MFDAKHVPITRFSWRIPANVFPEFVTGCVADLCFTGIYLFDVTAGVTIGAFVGMSDATTLPTARVIFIAVIAVGWRLLTVPFCRGFAGIEAFNAFMAVKSQYFLFSTGTDNPFERGVPDNNV